MGVFVLFVSFSALLYNGFSRVLYDQETTHVNRTLDTVLSRVNNLQGHFNAISIAHALQPTQMQPGGSPRADAKPYQSPLVTDLSRDSTTVVVYSAQKNQLYSSRQAPIDEAKFSKTRHVGAVKQRHFNGLVGTTPIYSADHQTLLGYVQVTNAMGEYKSARGKLFAILTVLILSAVFFAAIIGYGLAAYLLRPVVELDATIQAVRADPQTEERVALTRQNDELADLSHLFNDMLDQMQRYIDQQQQFVEDVSHELRTPVAVIQGHIDLLQRWGKDDPEVLNESLTATLQETKRMQSLVAEMLDLTRAEQIEVTFKNETTDVKEVVNQVYNDFKMIHPDFTFILDDDIDDHAYAQIYRNHLEQVLIILLDNAVKYSTKRREIHLSLARGVQTVEIAVQDFGEGLSETNVKRVFHRFYRVDKARSRNKGGNGLGLSIAQRLIEAYHGKIGIESVLGRGSVFQIALPLISDDERQRLTEIKAATTKADKNKLTTNLGANPSADESKNDSPASPGVYRAGVTPEENQQSSDS